MQLYYNKTQQTWKHFSITIDNKLSSDEHIITICKTANKNCNVLNRISHYMKQNQQEILLSSFIISHLYCPVIWMFCSKKSTKKINEKSLRIIWNDYESFYPLLLEEGHQ